MGRPSLAQEADRSPGRVNLSDRSSTGRCDPLVQVPFSQPVADNARRGKLRDWYPSVDDFGTLPWPPAEEIRALLVASPPG